MAGEDAYSKQDFFQQKIKKPQDWLEVFRMELDQELIGPVSSH